MSQNGRLLAHLEQHGSITSMEAFVMLGITQLSARISELEKLDYVIARDPVKVPTRDGKANILRYRLVSQPASAAA